jgi:hypothetical protein
VKYRGGVIWLVIWGACLALAASACAGAEGEGQQPQIAVPSSEGSPSATGTGLGPPPPRGARAVAMPVYRPPLRGAPEGRVAGGSRSPADEMPVLYLLAPDHVGLTTKEQPVLFWFISEVKKHPLELSIIEVSTHEPIFEARLKPPRQPGIQTFRLADHGVRLRIGTLYRCFVRMMPDPAHPSRDLVSFGDVRRVELSETLRMHLKGVPKATHVHVFAEEGLWYDALAAVSDSINTSPKETPYREQRASLLMQAGLKDVAEYEIEHTASHPGECLYRTPHRPR